MRGPDLHLLLLILALLQPIIVNICHYGLQGHYFQ